MKIRSQICIEFSVAIVVAVSVSIRSFYLLFFLSIRRILQLATKREHENYMTMVFLCVINNQIHGVIEILRVCDRTCVCEIKSITLHHNATVQNEQKYYYS